MRDSAWSFDGSIMTFAFPMLLFIVVAVALYVLYTKPAVVPGHRSSTAERPVSYTAMPGTPAATEAPGGPVGPVDPVGPAPVAGRPGPVPGALADADGVTAADGADAAPGVQE